MPVNPIAISTLLLNLEVKRGKKWKHYEFLHGYTAWHVRSSYWGQMLRSEQQYWTFGLFVVVFFYSVRFKMKIHILCNNTSFFFVLSSYGEVSSFWRRKNDPANVLTLNSHRLAFIFLTSRYGWKTVAKGKQCQLWDIQYSAKILSH